MDKDEFKRRTKDIGLRTIRLVKALPRDRVTQHVARQMLSAATSIGANYRAACRGRSPADVIAKLKIVEEESDETLYWMECLIDSGAMTQRRLGPLMSEVGEILAMVVASIKTLRRRYGRP